MDEIWVRGKRVAEILLEPKAGVHAWMNPNALEKCIGEHTNDIHKRGKQLWALTAMELWMGQPDEWRRATSKCMR